MIRIEPLTPEAFAPFGDVLDATGDFRLINEGLCQRHHDRARLDFGKGQPGLSVFKAQPRPLPYRLTLIERHPLGSQAFMPMHDQPFLVITAPEITAQPRAFLTNGAQGVNLLRGTWHGVLTPLSAPGLFVVLDRIAPPGDRDPNLEEHHFPTPWDVQH